MIAHIMKGPLTQKNNRAPIIYIEISEEFNITI